MNRVVIPIGLALVLLALTASAPAAAPRAARCSHVMPVSLVEAVACAGVSAGAETTNNDVVGAWHALIYVGGAAAPFDTLYLFSRDGGFARIDGRNGASALGAWTESGGRVTLSFMLFSFDPAGRRIGTVTVQGLGRVRHGVLSGSFTATGVDLTGATLPGYPKSGTYSATRISA